ncbi:hypothetical protein ANCCAN_28675, partial [Ancylostoma caninum]
LQRQPVVTEYSSVTVSTVDKSIIDKRLGPNRHGDSSLRSPTPLIIETPSKLCMHFYRTGSGAQELIPIDGPRTVCCGSLCRCPKRCPFDEKWDEALDGDLETVKARFRDDPSRKNSPPPKNDSPSSAKSEFPRLLGPFFRIEVRVSKQEETNTCRTEKIHKASHSTSL